MQETQETQDRSLGREDPLEEGMATHSSVLAWRIPWTEEPGGLQTKGDPMDCMCIYIHIYTHIYIPRHIYMCVCVCVCVCVWKETYDQPRQHMKKQTLLCQQRSSQGYGFSSSHVWMCELVYKEG